MKLVKIQNTIKIISDLKTDEVLRLVNAGKNVLYNEHKKPVYGINYADCPSFRGKEATFNQTSDKGFAMLTLECDQDYYASFATEKEAIEAFAEANLEAIHNLKAAEAEFKAIISSLNSSVKEIVDTTKIITID